MFQNKKALLLDMNSTFMFGEDRFGEDEDYSEYYKSIDGILPDELVNTLINRVYSYLDERYPSEIYRHSFPSLGEAIDSVCKIALPADEKSRLIETFSYHEHGEIPEDYISALRSLNQRFTLALVIDIWAPKDMWLNTFDKLGISELFAAKSFSSDCGIVKPSPKPFEMIIHQLGLPKDACLVVGDSIRRDLGGSHAAGLECILVGGARDAQAIASFSNLLEFQSAVL